MTVVLVELLAVLAVILAGGQYVRTHTDECGHLRFRRRASAALAGQGPLIPRLHCPACRSVNVMGHLLVPHIGRPAAPQYRCLDCGCAGTWSK